MKLARDALSLAAVAIVATTSALAQSTPPQPDARNGASLPQHNCVLKTLSACKPNGSCTPVDNLKGEKLPVKVTVDFDAGIIAGVDPDGWVNATRIASLARTSDEIILQGIDNAVPWQLMIYEKGPTMSLSLTSADSVSVGFGDCTTVKDE